MIVVFHPPPHLVVQLEGRDAPRLARNALASLLVHADQALISNARLVTSELVTNAIQAAAACTLSAWFLDDLQALRIEVSDASPHMPQLRESDDHRVGGYGLRIVGELSSHWGVTTDDGGKTVWAELTGDQFASGSS